MTYFFEKSFLSILSISLVLMGCINNSEKKLENFSHECVLDGYYQIPLDSVTDRLPYGYSGVFRSNNPDDSIFEYGKDYFQFISNSTGEWLVYDLATSNNIFRLKLTGDGPVRFAPINAFLPKNADSILVLNFPYVTLINHKGEILKNINALTPEKLGQFIPQSYVLPVWIDDVLITGIMSENLPPNDLRKKVDMEELIGAIMYIDITTGEKSFKHEFSNQYLNGNYLSTQMYFGTLHAFDSNTTALLGFPHSDSLFVIEGGEIKKQFLAKSKFFNTIAPLTPKLKDFDHYRMNYCYRSHFYDAKNKIIYRVVSLPISEDNLENPDIGISRFKNIAVIAVNENFEKVAETVLPENFHDLMAFVSDGKLYLWDKEKSFSDEDNIHFGVFELKDKITN